MASGVYQIENKIDGKRYIGSAVNLDKRKREHFTRLRCNSHPNPHMRRSAKIYGAENFMFKVLVDCSSKNVLLWEQIALDSLNPEYNMCPTAGNTAGRKFSEETKDKIRQKAIGRKCPPRSAEYCKKLSEVQKGRKKSAEHIAALQAGRANRIYTEEQRSAISLKLKESYDSGKRSKERSAEYREKIGRAFAKFSDEQVRSMRTRFQNGERNCDLAEEFQVCDSTMLAILRSKKYKWVK